MGPLQADLVYMVQVVFLSNVLKIPEMEEYNYR